MDFCPPFIARRLLGFDTVFKIDDKPDFLIFPQRFCFGNIHALDTLLYRFFRIGRAERLCAVLKKHAFRMSPLRLNRKMLMFGTLGLPSLKRKVLLQI